jgi:hypothetical protein
MKKIIVLLNFLFILKIALANNVTLSNVSIINNGPSNIQVQFDISWENSWRIVTGPNNYDGAWVFFKYKTATGNWTHLHLKGTNNSTNSQYEIYQNSAAEFADGLRTGAMIYRSATNLGGGTLNFTGVRLGVNDALPYNIDVRGFAIEMVYIPSYTGTTPYAFGDGNGTSESLNAFHGVDNTNTLGTNLLKADGAGDDELITDGIRVFNNDTIQLTVPDGPLVPFPGLKAKWCMKYEISQAGYRDFLNTLTLTQQITRTRFAPTSAVGTAALVSFPGERRNYIEIATSSASGNSAIYGTDASSNNIFDEFNDGEWVTCGDIFYEDVAAYLDWSGLCPMTELQYEHIARGHTSAGPNNAILGEYAWGTNTINTATITSNFLSQANEATTNASTTLGNANFISINMVRNGIFATSTSNRITSGASFFGVMELSGSATDYAIMFGYPAGRSCSRVQNGNGILAPSGNAQLISSLGLWPGMDGISNVFSLQNCTTGCEVNSVAGISSRGGSAGLGVANVSLLAISSRPTGNGPTGGRGILNIR